MIKCVCVSALLLAFIHKRIRTGIHLGEAHLLFDHYGTEADGNLMPLYGSGSYIADIIHKPLYHGVSYLLVRHIRSKHNEFITAHTYQDIRGTEGRFHGFRDADQYLITGIVAVGIIYMFEFVCVKKAEHAGKAFLYGLSDPEFPAPAVAYAGKEIRLGLYQQILLQLLPLTYIHKGINGHTVTV